MSVEHFTVEAVKWWGVSCLVASFVNRALPEPQEYHWRAYTFIYDLVRRLAMNSTPTKESVK